MERSEKLHRLAAAVRWLSQVDGDLLADDVAEQVVLDLVANVQRPIGVEDLAIIRQVARAAATITMAKVTEATGNAMAGAWP